MLIDFFYTLRSAKLPVSVKEYLTLLQALQAGVVGPRSDDAWSLDDFYSLARLTLVKDERHYDRFDRAFGGYFKGVELVADFSREIPADRLAAQDTGQRAHARTKSRHREDGLGRTDADAEKAPRRAKGTPRGRQQVDRHRRHQPLWPWRLQPPGRAHRRRGQEPQCREGLGAARLQGLRRSAGTGHAQHQGGAAPLAQVRARRP